MENFEEFLFIGKLKFLVNERGGTGKDTIILRGVVKTVNEQFSNRETT